MAAILWAPYLAYFIYWLVKKKPLRKKRIYEFMYCRFSISV